MKKIFLVFLLLTIAYTQDKKDQLKKNNKDRTFNNSEDTKEYIEMCNKSFELLLNNYADSINESEVIKNGMKKLHIL